MEETRNTPEPARFDVFLSHSSKDRNIANAACATLEQAGIRCWIAPRDIAPGADWGESIITALDSSKVFVLIFSDHANQSPQIKREVERAVAKGVIVMPVRIENVVPQKSLEYFISSAHWLDAFPPPLEGYFEKMADSILAILGTPASKRPCTASGKKDRRRFAWGLIAVVSMGLLAGIWYFASNQKPTSDSGIHQVQPARPLPILIDKTEYEEGDVMTLEITIPQPGHLRVYGIDADGNIMLLFPNRWNSTDKVEKGKVILPGDNSEWDIAMVLKEGQTFTRESIQVILSSRPFSNTPVFDATGFSPMGKTIDVERPLGSGTEETAQVWQGKASYTISK